MQLVATVCEKGSRCLKAMVPMTVYDVLHAVETCPKQRTLVYRVHHGRRIVAHGVVLTNEMCEDAVRNEVEGIYVPTVEERVRRVPKAPR